MKIFIICISGHAIETFYDFKNYITIGKDQIEIYKQLATHDYHIQTSYNIFNSYEVPN